MLVDYCQEAQRGTVGMSTAHNTREGAKMKVEMRRASAQVEILLDLDGMIDHRILAYLSEAGALLYPDRIGVEYITSVSLAATGTHLYNRPRRRENVCRPGPVCPACEAHWYEDTR